MITEQDKLTILKIAKKYNVSRVLMFGSSPSSTLGLVKFNIYNKNIQKSSLHFDVL